MGGFHRNKNRVPFTLKVATFLPSSFLTVHPNRPTLLKHDLELTYFRGFEESSALKIVSSRRSKMAEGWREELNRGLNGVGVLS